MRTAIVVAAILFAVAACGKDTPGAAGPGGAAPPAPAAAPAPPATADGLYDFEADAEGAAPKGFHSGLTGAGKAGTWVVRVPEGGAGRVLAQTDADPTMDRYPIAIAPAPSLADLRVSVRGRALSGLEDEAFGVVFRYRDDRNYYLARANALEANVRIYCVKDGWRREFGSADAEVKERTWHDLAVEAKGDRYAVFFDGKKLLEAKDSIYAGPGRAGVWTKADSVSEFDDLRISPL